MSEYDPDGQGTPKNLDEAIGRFMPKERFTDKERDLAYYIIKDFVAQQFGVIVLQLSEPDAAMVMQVFKKLSKR